MSLEPTQPIDSIVRIIDDLILNHPSHAVKVHRQDVSSGRLFQRVLVFLLYSKHLSETERNLLDICGATTLEQSSRVITIFAQLCTCSCERCARGKTCYEDFEEYYSVNCVVTYRNRAQDFRSAGNRQRPEQADGKIQGEKTSTVWLKRCVDGWMRLIFRSGRPVKSTDFTRRLTESLLYAFALKSRKHTFTHKETGRCTSSWKVFADNLGVVELSAPGENRSADVVKYWTNLYMWRLAQSQDELPPERPSFISEDAMFSGWMNIFLRRRFNKKDFSFFLSLQQSKRYWLALSEEKELAALQKHQKLLSTKRAPLPKGTVEQIKETCNMIFFKKKAPRTFTKMTPSKSACLQTSRKDGGALALFGPFTPTISPTISQVVGKTLAADLALKEYREDVFWTGVDRVEHKDPFGEEESRSIDLWTQVVSIPEPGKFRIITKMDGNLATVLQPLQGNLLSCWKETSWNTMSNEVDELVARIAKDSREPFWCSGDYQASTDYLSAEASSVALGFILDRVHTPVSKRLILDSLTSSMIEYPDLPGLRPSVLQKNGQLMGHPLSFPLLCAINLSYYRRSIELWSEELIEEGVWDEEEVLERVRAMRRNVIINGDDILFKCDRRFFEIWKEVCEQGGLLLSPGKCYLSRSMAQINSRTFVEKRGDVKRIGYLNLKLVLGYSLKGGDSEANPEMIGKDLSQMCDLAPWTAPSLPLAFSKWEGRFGGKFRPNWFLPPILGGYGVSVKWLDKEDLRLTLMQRKVAAMFATDPKLALTKNILHQAQLPKDLRNILPPTALVVFGGEAPAGFEPLKERWTARLSLYSSLMNVRPVTPDQFYFSLTKSWQSCKPMSVKKIISYLSCETYVAVRSEPPPLLDLGYWRLTVEEKRPNGHRFNPNRPSCFGEGSVPKHAQNGAGRVDDLLNTSVLNKMSRDCTERVLAERVWEFEKNSTEPLLGEAPEQDVQSIWGDTNQIVHH